MTEKTYERSEEMEQLAREVIASDDRWIIPHDVEDFKGIIQNEGVDWAVPEALP